MGSVLVRRMPQHQGDSNDQSSSHSNKLVASQLITGIVVSHLPNQSSDVDEVSNGEDNLDDNASFATRRRKNY